MEAKKEAYQRQGIYQYLRHIIDPVEAYDISFDKEYDCDVLRYRYNIPVEAMNKYWYMALR